MVLGQAAAHQEAWPGHRRRRLATDLSQGPAEDTGRATPSPPSPASRPRVSGVPAGSWQDGQAWDDRGTR